MPERSPLPRRHTTADHTAIGHAAGGGLRSQPPYDPETKGIVERANGYLRTSFLPADFTYSSPSGSRWPTRALTG